jgi:AAA domain-containing protein/DNA primase RepB-like protein
MTPMPSPDHAEAERRAEAQTFLDALASGGRFMFQTFDENADRKDKSLARKLYGTLNQHWRELNELNERGAGVYITVNETDGKGRETANITAVRAVFVDFDGQPQPDSLHLPPTVITETSPGRWHYFWSLRDCQLEQFTPLQKRLIALYGSDPKIVDLPRVMRVPGFLHRKREPFLSKLLYAGDEQYSVEEFAEALPPEPEPETRERVEPPRPGEQIGTRDLNTYALKRLDWWFPLLFRGARKSAQGWRVSSKDVGRNLEEDISATRDGIVDFGVADMGDGNAGKRTPIDLVMEWNGCDFKGAVTWLHRMLGLPAPVWQGNGRDDSAPLEQQSYGGGSKAKALRFTVKPFEAIKLSTAPNYLVKGIIPRTGLVVVWGPPKCGKSFWIFDLSMHIALGQKYRNKRVQQGTVVYFALEGGGGFAARVEAWRRRHLATRREPVPFHLLDVPIDLVADRNALIKAIRQQVVEPPACVIVDTLNRAMLGDENKSDDMAKFIRAADAIRVAFNCVVIIIHHCGVAKNRPRGHTSLAGADDAQIAVERNDDGIISAKVEHMKDAEAGAVLASKLERVELGNDDDGDPLSSCIIVPSEVAAVAEPKKKKLPLGQQYGLTALKKVIANGGPVQPPAGHPFPANWVVVESDQWREEFYKLHPSDKVVTKRQALFRATLDLEEAGFIAIWKDYVAMRDSVT